MNKELEEIIKNSENIVFFGGAGVSTESGIPDFRSESGLFRAKEEYGVSPETILSHNFYKKNTEKFYDYYKNNMVYLDAVPNNAHKALVKLEKEGKLKAIVTQNIDGLHQKAGSKNVYELHGSIYRNTCTRCGKKYDLNYIMEEKNCIDLIPICNECEGVIKPDVVLYDEALDNKVIDDAIKAISSCDTLIIGGTSLAVYPAAGLINYFKGNNLILINKTKTPYDQKADLVIYGEIGKVMI